MAATVNGHEYTFTDFVGTDGKDYSRTNTDTGETQFPDSVMRDLVAELGGTNPATGVTLNGHSYSAAAMIGSDGRGYAAISPDTSLVVFPDSVFKDMLLEIADKCALTVSAGTAITVNGHAYQLSDFVGADGLGYVDTHAVTGETLFPDSILIDVVPEFWTARWQMSSQTSTNGALIDYSGGPPGSMTIGHGHHGWYGGVKKVLIADTTTGVRACIFNNVASNTVTLAGLANSTAYDMTITYHDGTTDTHSLTTSGAGVMTFAAATDAKFTNLQVKTIVIVPSGGGATVDTVDFTAQAQGTRSFTTGGGRTVTVNQAGTSTAEPTLLWYSGTVYAYFPGTANNTVSVAGLSNSTVYDYTVTYLDTTTAAGTATSDGSGNLVMGGISAEFAAKNVKSIVVVPDGGGATVANVDFTAATYNATYTSFVCATGQTVTINRAATGLKTAIVTENVALFDGVDDYISVDDHARLDFAAGEKFTAVVRGAVPIVTLNNYYMVKYAGSGAGWGLLGENSGDAKLRLIMLDGTNTVNAYSAVGSITAYARQVWTGRRGAQAQSLVNGVGGTVVADTTVDLSNTSNLQFGQRVGGSYQAFEFFSAALFRRALSATQVSNLSSLI